VLRTAGFALLGLVDTLPALLVASAATGFAGTLFNPAVRSCLACDAAGRRIGAFAIFNVFYRAGILAHLGRVASPSRRRRVRSGLRTGRRR
jgi:hypothetical protein